MTNTFPYIILSVRLELAPNISFPNIDKAGYYCVFWWKEIPLGHLYIEKNEKISPYGLKEKVLASIKPTIDFYLDKRSITETYEEKFLNQYSKFTEWMDDLLSPYMPVSIPEKVDVSIVICTRNRSTSLKACLESLHKQECMPQEIIVVDNAPTDESTKTVVEQFPGVTYCKEMKPGLDIARNTGAKQATCAIVAYTDDDVQVEKLWTYRVWEAFLDDKVQAITGLIISISLETESQQIFEKHWGFNKGYRDIYFTSDFLNSGFAPKVWGIGAGANMAFRKKVLEIVNYFDDRLDVGAAGCSGDSEVWYRILASGYTIQYTPRVVVYHEHRKELSALRKQVFNYMRGHAASVLIQHQQNKNAGYKKYLYTDLLKYYIYLIRAGFPNYSFRYQTIFTEIKGILSGVQFYNKNKSKPPNSS